VFLDFTIHSLFENQFGNRLEEVGIETKKGIELVEKEEFVFGLIARVSNRFSHHGPVLLFDITVIILLGRSRPGEGDLFFLTVPNELVIDEFSSIVRINS
jgi:hypothetical protein